ncbi:MAG: 16S rRNA (cytosine(1402)-N(4))-methyltransferase RsmH, partial [candidate division WOR-3 bacterium]
TKERCREYSSRLMLFEENFINIDLILKETALTSIDGFLFDLGASYHQLTTPWRGFSFNEEGPLSMQMSPESVPLYKKLRNATKVTIHKILKEYGDVPHARQIAHLIYEKRRELKTTLDLRRLLEKNLPGAVLKKNLHRIFQALRIWVNDELRNLSIGLQKALRYLKLHGRIIVISYHSGEDRIAKRIFLDYEKKGVVIRLNKKVIRPSDAEIKKNPSARSARMRVIERCA